MSHAGSERAAPSYLSQAIGPELDSAGRPGSGDPTELALLLAAAEYGIQRSDIERARPRELSPRRRARYRSAQRHARAQPRGLWRRCKGR